MTRLLHAIITLSLAALAQLQEPAKPVPPEKSAEPQAPAQIELLETKVRFETNGDSRKEVHALVKINSELGIQQFARLNFDYNRAFQQIEIPLVRVTHSSGGTADILPSAVTDNPNPSVVNFLAYHDVRVKSVRILGLAPSDTLEYRVITTTTHHPLAPDFWLDHTFDRSGIVSRELFELDLPSPRLRIRINPETPATRKEESADGESSRVLYRWDVASQSSPKDEGVEPDITLTTFTSWDMLSEKLHERLEPKAEAKASAWKKAAELVGDASSFREKLQILYDFVSQKVATIDLPLGSSGFQTRSPLDILTAGHATAEDKFALFESLQSAFNSSSRIALVGASKSLSDRLPRPSLLPDLLVLEDVPQGPFPGGGCSHCYDVVWLDLTVQVAPFGAIPASLRGKEALVSKDVWLAHKSVVQVPEDLPFPSSQKVAITARIASDGLLTAKVKYTMRGDNELLLRVAFHQSSREKWNEVAQLLSLSDGFRGKVSSVSASDPYATKDPFTVEYEITQPKFVDWSKKPVRIPAVLPLVGLPDPPTDAKSPIELGTPLDVQTSLTLHLPPGTTVESPAGTTVERDYGTFSSKYAASGNTITATRHTHFIAREVPANRTADYSAFVHAVQNDQAQRYTLTNPDIPAVKPANPAKPQANRLR